MTTFSYRAKNQQGATVRGQVEAFSVVQAAELLRKQQLTIISLTPVQNTIFRQLGGTLQRVSLDDLVIVTRQFSTMIAAGLPLTDALRILQVQTRPAMSRVLGDVLRDVEGGASFADSLAKHPRVFSEIYVALVRAGESAGVLDDVLNRLAGNLEKQKQFNGKVIGALIYPLIVVIGMVIVAFIMMVFVIPKLTVMYQNFDAKLPTITVVLIAVSSFMAAFWWIILAAAGGGIFLFRAWIQTPLGKRQWEEFMFKVPIIGRLRQFIMLTEFTRTLGLLVGAGISIVEGLKITAAAVGNSIYQEGLLRAASQVEKGLPLAVPLAQNPHFPPILSQMVSVGEETGKVDEVLLKISHYFESESEQGVAALTAAVEPLIMIVLGIGVGLLVVAVILPIYNLTGSL